MKNKKKMILIPIILLIICFIWSNSLENPSESYHRSNEFLAYADKFLSSLLGNSHSFVVFFRSHVRKIAHFIEYGMLGTAAGASMVLFEKLKLRHFYNALSAAVIAAVIDEYIQLYTFRGSSVKDVIIDFSGYTAGLIFAMFIAIVIKLIKLIIKRRHKDDTLHS